MPIPQETKSTKSVRPVIVRAYQDRPVALSAVNTVGLVVYVIGSDAGSPMGFPKDRVYKFDADCLRELQDLYSRGDMQALSLAWERLAPVSGREPDAPKG